MDLNKVLLTGILSFITSMLLIKYSPSFDNIFVTISLIYFMDALVVKDYKRLLRVGAATLIYTAILFTTLFIGILIGLL